MTSIIVSVRKDLIAALKTAIQGTAGMEDVYVEFQHPTGDHSSRERVWTQNARVDLANASMKAGKNFSNETSAFDLVFSTWAPAQTAEDAADRVIEIATVASDWIANHKNGETLTASRALGLISLTVSGSGTQTESLDNDSITGRLQLPVTFTARLT